MYKVPKQNIANADYVYPRTLQDAFGSGGPVEDKDEMPPMDWQDKIVLWVAPAALLFVTLLLVLES